MVRSSPSRDETSSEAIKVSIGPRDRVTRAKYKRERERESRGRKVCENVQPLSSPRSFEAGRDRRADRKVASGRSFFFFFPQSSLIASSAKTKEGGEDEQ